MVSQQFNNQVFYICIAAGKRLAFLCLEDDVLNLLYLSRRTRQTALFRITVYIGYAPFCDIQIRTAFIQRSIRQFSSVFGNGSFFLTTQCTFVLLYQFRIARTARIRRYGVSHGYVRLLPPEFLLRKSPEASLIFLLPADPPVRYHHR